MVSANNPPQKDLCFPFAGDFATFTVRSSHLLSSLIGRLQGKLKFLMLTFAANHL